MRFGVCYYPEHWPAERWSLDAQLMRAAGLTYVRIAEFAWQLIEPAEGEFSWEWLDTAIETLAAEGLQTILSTPTATPPAWMVKAYPQILPVDAEGRRRHFGSRRHYCPTSEIYREQTRRIVTALAARYGKHPAVAGWQIDNEFGCHDTTRCYCDECAAALRRWLRERYGSLEALNAAWGTVFWSQTYDEWAEIFPPRLTVTEPNPSHVLDYYRFASDMTVSYQQLQVELLREQISPEQFVTTNFMGAFPDLDYHKLAQPLDLVTVDSYPTGFAETEQLYQPDEPHPQFAYDVGDPLVTGFGHTLTYGLKQQPYWMMEQQVGHINWASYNTGVRAGTPRLWTWHTVASGADAVVYFRWRACRFAQEQQHSGLLRHDGSFDVGYQDLLALQAELPQLEALTAAPVEPEVALLLNYQDLWALQLQPHRRDFSYLRHLFVYYRALQQLGIPVAIVPYAAQLAAYRLVIVPTAFLGDAVLAVRLTEYAAHGGTLLLGVRSGFKTPSNLVTAGPLPGPFRALIGAQVNVWHALPPGVGYEFESQIPTLSGPATFWAESVTPDAQTRALATYTAGPFAGTAALTERTVAAGRALYLGCYPTVEQARGLLSPLAAQEKIQRLAELPVGLVAARRGEQLVILNFTDQPLTAQVDGEPVVVPPRDVRVVKKR
ncbi:MAG: beta-galactosidase [Chloroflexota bacterium]|nr:beta-galactosidase [Chloroflexota bacterium]